MRDYGTSKARNRALNNVNTISDYMSIDSRFSSWQIRSFGSHALSVLVLLIAFVAVGRVIMGGSIEDINTNTLLLDILDNLSNQSFATQQLMSSIRGVANIQFVTVGGADAVLDVLRNFIPVIQMIVNIIWLLASCVLCAVALIGCVFDLLFIAL